MGLLGALWRIEGEIALVLLLIAAGGVAGCIGDEGVPPPPGIMHFPIAAIGYPEVLPEYLFVANSNFDLLFNTGTVQSYDVQVMNDEIDAHCAGVLQKSRCSIIPNEIPMANIAISQDIKRVDNLLLSEVFIGSYSDGMAVTGDGRRLYLPVRSDAGLTYIDVTAEGLLSCGGTPGETHSCSSDHRSAIPTDARPVTRLSDPVALTTGSLADDFGFSIDGDWILMAHREGGVSLLVDRISPTDTRPILTDTLEDLAPESVTITFDPASKIAWMPSAVIPQISRIGVGLASDGATDEAQRQAALAGTIFDAGPYDVVGVDLGIDTREVKFSPDGRAFVVSRSPRALFIADQISSDGNLTITNVIPVGLGPARLDLAELPTSGPTPTRLFAFVSCFDSREIHIVDVDLERSYTMSTGISGAFELVIDSLRSRMYVVDFRTSVIRVVDLTPFLDCIGGAAPDPIGECTPPLIGMLGVPTPVQELQ